MNGALTGFRYTWVTEVDEGGRGLHLVAAKATKVCILIFLKFAIASWIVPCRMLPTRARRDSRVNHRFQMSCILGSTENHSDQIVPQDCGTFRVKWSTVERIFRVECILNFFFSSFLQNKDGPRFLTASGSSTALQ